MDEDLYDEFGNYIGQTNQVDEKDDDDSSSHQMERDMEMADQIDEMEEEPPQEGQIMLNEEKKYYPEMEDVFVGAETLIMEEDEQPIEKPIIDLNNIKSFYYSDKNELDNSYMISLMNNPYVIRNITFVGALHHGKTSLIDLFIKKTHPHLTKINKYTDHRHDEVERKVSLQLSSMTFLLETSKGKNFVMNICDAPGHPNFEDEAACGLRLSDGALLIVDVIEGCLLSTKRFIHYMMRENISFILFINKIDRLVLELKLPPEDAYLKIKNVIEEINIAIMECPFKNNDEKMNFTLSPLKHNVIFGSAEYGFMFTLKSFAHLYSQKYKINPQIFQKMLWGDLYYNRENDPGKFIRTPSKEFNRRTFVEFILEPLYKIIGYTVSHEKKWLEPFYYELGLILKAEDYKKDTKPFLKLVCSRLFGDLTALIDSIAEMLPSSEKGAKIKFDNYFLGPKNTQTYTDFCKGNSSGPLYIFVSKLMNTHDCKNYYAFARILSGKIKVGDSVQVLGERYNPEDREDKSICKIKKIWINQSRYKVEVAEATAGCIVLLEGIDQTILKTATLTSPDYQDPHIFRPIRHMVSAIVKVALEPLIPSELPKMVEGLRKVTKSYPCLTSKVEESGEHHLIGTGELYMDSVLHDLRKMYSEIEIKVAEPVVTFCETVVDTSSSICQATSTNGKNILKMTAEPIDKGLPELIENERLNLVLNRKDAEKTLENEFDWDLLSARSVWAFGPEEFGTNLLMDYTIPQETNPILLSEAKTHIIAGFKWACTEGPLCEEPIKNVKYKVIEAVLPEQPGLRGGGQIIPIAKRVCNSSFLMATPRIMEPILLVEIQCTADSIPAVYQVVNKRRGHVINESARSGSPLYIVKANIPALDSFGFETDLRVHTTGQAFCVSTFDNWGIIPGDPLDTNIKLELLEPSPPFHLPRDILLKTRRRKGLAENISVVKFFDVVQEIN